jgi:hypothetical protein
LNQVIAFNIISFSAESILAVLFAEHLNIKMPPAEHLNMMVRLLNTLT